jgi:hypothetical protein
MDMTFTKRGICALEETKFEVVSVPNMHGVSIIALAFANKLSKNSADEGAEGAIAIPKWDLHVARTPHIL